MKILLIILFLTPVVIVHGQKVNFEWAKQMGGAGLGGARGSSIVTDASGNIYTTGAFKGRVDFDPGQGVYDLVALGTEDFYISKLDRSGKLLWVRQMDVIPNVISATAIAITMDAAANIFITGNSFEAFGNSQCFVCKLDSAGNLIWTRTVGASSGGTAITTDVFGNVYAVGLFWGEVDFDPGPGVFNLGNFGNMAFIWKLDVNGNFAWAKETKGYQSGSGIYGQITHDVSIALDGSQNIYISGSFSGTVDFDPGPDLYNITSIGAGTAIFISKLDRDGNFAWAKQVGGNDEVVSISLSIDGMGSIYAAGNFTGTADFDPGPGVFNLISRTGIYNVGLFKLDGNGNFIWAKQFTGNIQWCYAFTLDDKGNIYTTGYFGKESDFDPGPGAYTLSTSGYDVFICKLNPDGNFIWAKQLGGTATIIANAIVVDVFGNVVTTGYFFSGQVDFDPGPGSFSLSGDGENIFIHKINQCLGNTSSAINASACKNYTLNGQTYTATGVYTQTLTSATGCDSVITLNLAINPIQKVITITTCNNFTFNNHIYSSSGVYTDTLTAVNGCDSIITLHLSVTPPSFTTITRAICEGQSFEGHTVNGTYTDTLVAGNGCDSIVTLYLTVLSAPSPDLGTDTSLCTGNSILLYPGKFTTYAWQDGSAEDHITVKKPGLYSVTVTDNCGSGTDQIVVEAGICDIYFPKAFTPNNDGINDLFKILRPGNLTGYHLSVFNRWGQKVFETSDYSKGWNGRFKGQVQPSETFVWYCTFKKQGNANKITMTGIVTLVR